MQNNTIFHIENVDLFYGEKQALKQIQMDIQKNSVTALIGPSGCGKSTFLRCLNRMNDLIDDCRIEGNILFENTDIYKGDMNVVDLRTRVGMVFQKPNPFPMSIYDNIAYGPRCQGIKDKTILDAIVKQSLEKAALWEEVKDRLKDSAFGLSGGQQQRVAIARAIYTHPTILLGDELTGNLDSTTSISVMKFLKKMCKKYSQTMIIVTHDERIAAMADRIIQMKDGRVV